MTPENMELELGLKLARVADEFTSADFHIAKDSAGPLFLSTETDVCFNLTAYLRGYKKRNVKIEINEDGNQIVISGEKAIQESIFVDWKLYKKETEMRRFRKAFRIPDGVILDKIKAKFDEDESMVTVSMPKKERGICGFSIEEVKELEQVPLALGLETSETLQVGDDIEADGKLCNTLQNDIDPTGKDPGQTQRQKNDDDDDDDDMPEKPENIIQGSELLSPTCSTAVDNNTEITAEQDHENKSIPQDQSDAERYNPSRVLEKDQQGDEVKSCQGNQEGRPLDHIEREDKGSFKICVPAIAGTAFLLSFVVFVIHYIQTKSTPGKKKD